MKTIREFQGFLYLADFLVDVAITFWTTSSEPDWPETNIYLYKEDMFVFLFHNLSGYFFLALSSSSPIKYMT